VSSRGSWSWERLVRPAAFFTAVLVVSLYGQAAIALIGYPWDWSPDEGLHLDYGRRFARSPSSLYTESVVPIPDFYGPVLPALLAPLAARATAPLGPARALACLWTLLIAAATYRLVRSRSPPYLATITAALIIAPFHLSFWYLLVRPDGPMVALWLWAAVVTLPRSLERGSTTLSWPRAALGATLLAAAVFAKPVAVLHGAPLVLGWLLVDWRSALRLGGLVSALGVVVVAVLEIGTGGGYLHLIPLWATHGTQVGLWRMNVTYFIVNAAPILALALAGLARSLRAGGRPFRDPTWLLLIGGLLVVPALKKYGALPNYLLPLLCGLTAFAGRCWPRTGSSATASAALPSALAVVAALVLVRTESIPLPPRGAVATAQAFYAAVVGLVETGGRPLLALRPEYAYFLVDQPVEAEGSSFKFLLAASAPGAEGVLRGLEERRYRTVTLLTAGLTDGEPLAQALHRGYVSLGSCDLSYYYGPATALIMVPKDRRATFDPPPGTRCRVAVPAPTVDR
jgi:hypothetical protein